MENTNIVSGLGIVSDTVSGNLSPDTNHVDHMYGIMSGDLSPTTSMSTNLSSLPSIRGRSKVWNEFTITADGRKVTCRLCGDSLAYSNSHSTSSMLKHLKRKHNLHLYPTAIEDDVGNACVSDKGGKVFSAADKRNRPKPKKHIPKDAEEIDTSVQHGPLLFKDPCVRMKWTDHSDTFLRSFSALYSDESYTDVTLVAEKHYFKAHRVILSSASEFFDETFKMTPAGQHPAVFLKDVKAMDLRILLDFIYKGEVSIPPSLIPGLVKIGGDLRVRGLSDFVWNEQLASSIFQPQQQQSQTSQASQNELRSTRPMQNSVQSQPPPSQPNSVPAPIIPSTSGNPLGTITNQIGSPNVSASRPIPSVRTMVRQLPPLLASSAVAQSIQQQAQTNSFANGPPVPRTYSRILNIRPTSSETPTSLQGQLLSGDLGAVCSTVASTFPAMKRIRIVTSGAAGLPQKTMAKLGTDGSCVQSVGENDPESETVLMVTNQGDTMLSTSQGGVTMALPVGVTLKDGQYQSTSSPITSFQSTQIQSQPVTVLTSAHSQQHRSEELDVVYSIAEIPGSTHNEVLMAHDQSMIVCEDESDEMVEKKPFIST